MDLLHVDFTSIKTTMEPNRLPKVTNMLVFQDHFMKYIMAYVTPNQTTKTVAKFLYQGYIPIFGALARLLSDCSANFMTNIISEMCKLLGIKKMCTTPYYPQMNWLLERSHQTLMQMIGKLGEAKKADWQGHLAEIVHAYNATQSAVIGYSPHYLMFWHRPRLPADFYFPTLRSTEVPKWGAPPKHEDEYIATVQDWLRATLHEAQAQSMAQAQRQKWYYNQKVGAIGLKPGNLILVKADPFLGKMKFKERWEDKPHEVVHQIMTDIPSYEVKDQSWNSHILYCNWLLLFASEAGIPLHVGICQAWDGCTSPTPVKPTPKGSNSKTTSREDWSGNHPASGLGRSLGVDKWEAKASPMDISQSIHWRWVKFLGHVYWMWTSSLTEWQTGSHAFGGGTDINPWIQLDSRLDDHHACSQNKNMVARPLWYEMGTHPSVSSSLIISHCLPWYGILPLFHRGTPAATFGVA